MPPGNAPTGTVATTQGGGGTCPVPAHDAADPASMTDTVPEPKFEMYANGAATAAVAAISISARTLNSIPETRRVPENPLGSGHLVFMPLS
jgi:hypothetical protein